MTQFTLIQIQKGLHACQLKTSLIILHVQVIQETLRLQIWLFDGCVEEQSHTFIPTWGCIAYSVQTKSQHVWVSSEGQKFHPLQLADESIREFSTLEAGAQGSDTEICRYGSSWF